MKRFALEKTLRRGFCFWFFLWGRAPRLRDKRRLCRRDRRRRSARSRGGTHEVCVALLRGRANSSATNHANFKTSERATNRRVWSEKREEGEWLCDCKIKGDISCAADSSRRGARGGARRTRRRVARTEQRGAHGGARRTRRSVARTEQRGACGGARSRV